VSRESARSSDFVEARTTTVGEGSGGRAAALPASFGAAPAKAMGWLSAQPLRVRSVPWLRSALGEVTLAFVASRAIAWGFGVLGAHGHLEGAVVQWDAFHYLEIVHHGYPAHENPQWVFFPLYPVLARTVALGVLISAVGFWGALWMIHLLAEDLLGEAAARRAVWFAALFPVSFFFTAYYTEGLALCLAVGACLAATRERPAIAAFLGFDASLAHGSSMVALAVPLLLIPQRHWRERLLAAAGPLLGVLAFLLFALDHTGHLLAPLHAERTWGHEFNGPFGAVWPAFRDVLAALSGESPARWSYEIGWLREFSFLVLVLVVAATVWCLRRLRRPYGIAYGLYLLAFLALDLSYAWPEHPLSGFPRYAAALFPIYFYLGATLKGRTARFALVVQAIGLAALSWRFGHGGWVA
jgi:hypothetical protein